MSAKFTAVSRTWRALEPEQRLVAIFLTLLALIAVWAMLSSIDRIVRAEGRIVAAGRSQIVQHLEGGIVSEITVREGQSVQAGDVLMRFSTVQANSSVQQGQSQIDVLKARQARLEAEVNGLSAPVFDSSMSEDTQQQELSMFRARTSHQQAERMVLSQQVEQRQAELIEASSRAAGLAHELELARQQSGLMEGLYKKGAASQMEMLEAQGRTQRLRTQHNDVASSIPRLQAAVSETQARLNELVNRYRADVRNELSQVTAELSTTTFAVSGDEDRLSRTEVRAPMAGYVNRLHFNTIGGVAKPGDPAGDHTQRRPRGGGSPSATR